MTAPILPTNHNMHRRAKIHDYSRRGTYMVTLVANNRKAVFGSLDCERAKVVLSPFGEAVAKDEVRRISLYYPSVTVWKLCVMPDHLHMILHVGQNLPDGRHLGKVIAGFKQGCYRAYRQITGEEMSVFMAGYNDKILCPGVTLWDKSHSTVAVTVPGDSSPGGEDAGGDG